MFENYQISGHLRYEQHTLVLHPGGNKSIRIEGIIAAAVMSAVLAHTDEGDKRELSLDSPAEVQEWIKRYKQEVLPDIDNRLDTEVTLLATAYSRLDKVGVTQQQLCRNNIRQSELATKLVVRYMQQLVAETYGAHIWDAEPWQSPFAHWLLQATYTETKRQRFMHINWTDPDDVISLAEHLNEFDKQPSFVFHDETPAEIMAQHYKWLHIAYQAKLRETPGIKPDGTVYKNYVIKHEGNWEDLMDIVKTWDESTRKRWLIWMTDWQEYLNRQLKPQRQIHFWSHGVSEKRQAQLTEFIQLQEQQPESLLSVATAVYTLRQLGYVRRTCTVKDMTRWLSDWLTIDYSSKTNAYRFTNVFDELGRYSDSVIRCSDALAQMGVPRFTPIKNAKILPR